MSSDSGAALHLDPAFPLPLGPAPLEPAPLEPALPGTYVAAGLAAAAYPLETLNTVGAWHSKPAAVAKLFLDFDGAPAQTWDSYSVPETPAYDRDGLPNSFTGAELDAIQNIWSRVAEAYSPFDVDVTTQDPENRDDYQTLAVVIGGSGFWTGGPYGGVAYLGSFSNDLPNTVWVFPKNLGNGDPKSTASAAASPMLDLRLDLYTAAGDPVAGADTAALGETITATVPAGSYRLVVASHGGYGDLGQYTISGTVVSDYSNVATVSFPPKFFVVDAGGDDTFKYSAAGVSAGNFTLQAGNTDPRDIAANPDGSRLWVVDKDKNVNVYQSDGSAQGLWKADGLGKDPEGITLDGSDLWMADRDRKIHWYDNAAGNASGTDKADKNFSPKMSGNLKGLVTDGTYLWAVTEGGTDYVYRFAILRDGSGNPTGLTQDGKWMLATANSKPTGITLDPTGASQSLWIVDESSASVYEYGDGRSLTSGIGVVTTSFKLAATNLAPQGIADPPVDDQPIVTAASGDTTGLDGQFLAVMDSPRLVDSQPGGKQVGRALAVDAHLGEFGQVVRVRTGTDFPLVATALRQSDAVRTLSPYEDAVDDLFAAFDADDLLA